MRAAVYVALRNVLILELVREKSFIGALGLLCVVEGVASIVGGFVAGRIIDGSGPISLQHSPGPRPPAQVPPSPYSSYSRHATSSRFDRPLPQSPFNGALQFAASMLAIATLLSLILMCLARSDRKKRDRRRRAKNKRARHHAPDGAARRRVHDNGGGAGGGADGDPFPSDNELAHEQRAARHGGGRQHSSRDGRAETREPEPDPHESDCSSPSRVSSHPSPPHLSDHELGPVTIRHSSHEGSRESLPRGTGTGTGTGTRSREAVAPAAPASAPESAPASSLKPSATDRDESAPLLVASTTH